MKPTKVLLHASLFVLIVFVAVGLSKPDCEDGIIKSVLTSIAFFGAFPVAGIYLGLKGKKENRALYFTWGLLFSIPAVLAYMFFAFGAGSHSAFFEILGGSIKGGLPIITLFSTAIPFVITQFIDRKSVV